MNFMGKSSGGDSGTSRQQQQHQGEEEEEEERQNMAPTVELFPSSSSSSHHHQNQPPRFHPRGGWMFDGTTGGEPSSRVSDPMDNNNNTNNNDDEQQGMMMVVEREHMFDKVVTPSDVGKLNRLVIPKQHAERYFPLDSSTNDKGLLLNFEDRNGKPWRFRYSYWNSSQSYVMTKGWSRFVKDKKLDAGDIVSFQRGVGASAKDRLFIDWRHRPDAPSNLSFPLQQHQFSFHNRNVSNIHPWNPLFLQSQPAPSRSHSSLMLQPSSYRYGAHGGPYHNIGTGSIVNMNPSGSGSVIYFRSGHQQQLDMAQMQQRSGIGIDPTALLPPPESAGQSGHVVFESVPVVQGKAAAKRLRLFGVNMDCPIADDDDQEYDPTSEFSPTMVSSSTSTNPTHMGNNHQNYFHPHHHHHHHHDRHHHHQHNHPQTSSSSTIPYLQLRPYGEDFETQFHQNTMMPSSPTDAFNKTTKSSSSNSHMSLDLDI